MRSSQSGDSVNTGEVIPTPYLGGLIIVLWIFCLIDVATADEHGVRHIPGLLKVPLTRSFRPPACSLVS